MSRYIEENEIYRLFNANGIAHLHVGDIDVLPRVEAKEVVYGQWEWYWGVPWCSNCREKPLSYSYNGVVNATPYCPNCGAKMDGG